jgi:DNA-binding protein HU-beta
MNKGDLIQAMAKQAGITQQQAMAALQAFETSVIDTLATGGEVRLVGFGTFAVKQRAARLGRNPKTGESISIAASKVPVFAAGKGLKEAVL